VDGFEFLERAAIELDSTRFGSFVVILTTSSDPRDIERSATFDPTFRTNQIRLFSIYKPVIV